MTDPIRLGLPSASGAYARRRCLRQQTFIEELRSAGLLTEREPDEDAASGTRMHASIAGDTVSLSEDETFAVTAARRIEEMLVADWCRGLPFHELGREQRLWLRNGVTPIHSGQYDVAYVSDDWTRLFVIDYKFGRAEVLEALYNDQLRELVALAYVNNPPSLAEFTVAIIQPRVECRTTIAYYDRLEAELALRELRHHLVDIRAPEHARVPGSYCKYCPALPHCPEGTRLAELPADLAGAGKLLVGSNLLVGKDGSVRLEKLLHAKSLAEELIRQYKALLAADPSSLPGWHLKAPKTVRELSSDLPEIWTRAAQYGIELGAFLGATKCSVTALQKIFGDALDLKGTGLKDAFNEAFSDYLRLKERAPELERIKE